MRIGSTLFIALVALAACGKDKDKGGVGGGGGGSSAAGGKMEGGGGMGKRDKKPIPADKLVGTVRLINLGVGADGKTHRVDVWATGGWPAATKLASGIEFGKASDWFKTPIGVGMHLIVVPEGAPGEDAGKLASMSIGGKDKHETSVLWRERDKLTTVVNGGADELPKPAAGKGFVMLDAGQLMGFEKELTASPLGGRSFMVGEPGDTCSKAVLGGTNYTKHEVAPGKAKFTLHKWPGDCKSPALYTVEADVAADKGVRVEVFTKDGKSIEHTAMPIHFKP